MTDLGRPVRTRAGWEAALATLFVTLMLKYCVWGHQGWEFLNTIFSVPVAMFIAYYFMRKRGLKPYVSDWFLMIPAAIFLWLVITD